MGNTGSVNNEQELTVPSNQASERPTSPARGGGKADSSSPTNRNRPSRSPSRLGAEGSNSVASPTSRNPSRPPSAMGAGKGAPMRPQLTSPTQPQATTSGGKGSSPPRLLQRQQSSERLGTLRAAPIAVATTPLLPKSSAAPITHGGDPTPPIRTEAATKPPMSNSNGLGRKASVGRLALLQQQQKQPDDDDQWAPPSANPPMRRASRSSLVPTSQQQSSVTSVTAAAALGRQAITSSSQNQHAPPQATANAHQLMASSTSSLPASEQAPALALLGSGSAHMHSPARGGGKGAVVVATAPEGLKPVPPPVPSPPRTTPPATNNRSQRSDDGGGVTAQPHASGTTSSHHTEEDNSVLLASGLAHIYLGGGDGNANSRSGCGTNSSFRTSGANGTKRSSSNGPSGHDDDAEELSDVDSLSFSFNSELFTATKLIELTYDKPKRADEDYTAMCYASRPTSNGIHAAFKPLRFPEVVRAHRMQVKAANEAVKTLSVYCQGPQQPYNHTGGAYEGYGAGAHSSAGGANGSGKLAGSGLTMVRKPGQAAPMNHPRASPMPEAVGGSRAPSNAAGGGGDMLSPISSGPRGGGGGGNSAHDAPSSFSAANLEPSNERNDDEQPHTPLVEGHDYEINVSASSPNEKRLVHQRSGGGGGLSRTQSNLNGNNASMVLGATATAAYGEQLLALQRGGECSMARKPASQSTFLSFMGEPHSDENGGGGGDVGEDGSPSPHRDQLAHSPHPPGSGSASPFRGSHSPIADGGEEATRNFKSRLNPRRRSHSRTSPRAVMLVDGEVDDGEASPHHPPIIGLSDPADDPAANDGGASPIVHHNALAVGDDGTHNLPSILASPSPSPSPPRGGQRVPQVTLHSPKQDALGPEFEQATAVGDGTIVVGGGVGGHPQPKSPMSGHLDPTGNGQPSPATSPIINNNIPSASRAPPSPAYFTPGSNGLPMIHNADSHLAANGIVANNATIAIIGPPAGEGKKEGGGGVRVSSNKTTDAGATARSTESLQATPMPHMLVIEAPTPLCTPSTSAGLQPVADVASTPGSVNTSIGGADNGGQATMPSVAGGQQQQQGSQGAPTPMSAIIALNTAAAGGGANNNTNNLSDDVGSEGNLTTDTLLSDPPSKAVTVGQSPLEPVVTATTPPAAAIIADDDNGTLGGLTPQTQPTIPLGPVPAPPLVINSNRRPSSYASTNAHSQGSGGEGSMTSVQPVIVSDSGGVGAVVLITSTGSPPVVGGEGAATNVVERPPSVTKKVGGDNGRSTPQRVTIVDKTVPLVPTPPPAPKRRESNPSTSPATEGLLPRDEEVELPTCQRHYRSISPVDNAQRPPSSLMSGKTPTGGGANAAMAIASFHGNTAEGAAGEEPPSTSNTSQLGSSANAGGGDGYAPGSTNARRRRSRLASVTTSMTTPAPPPASTGNLQSGLALTQHLKGLVAAAKAREDPDAALNNVGIQLAVAPSIDEGMSGDGGNEGGAGGGGFLRRRSNARPIGAGSGTSN